MATNRPVWGIDLGQNALKASACAFRGVAGRWITPTFEHSRSSASRRIRPLAPHDRRDHEEVPGDAQSLQGDVVVAVPGSTPWPARQTSADRQQEEAPRTGQVRGPTADPLRHGRVIWDYQIFGNSPRGPRSVSSPCGGRGSGIISGSCPT